MLFAAVTPFFFFFRQLLRRRRHIRAITPVISISATAWHAFTTRCSVDMFDAFAMLLFFSPFSLPMPPRLMLRALFAIADYASRLYFSLIFIDAIIAAISFIFLYTRSSFSLRHITPCC